MCRIEKVLRKHRSIFHFFEEVYLFGSSLDDSIYSNDIDLLLIYKKYSQQFEVERKTISLYLEKLLKTDIDLTILSERELVQTKFLERLYSPYKRLK